MKNTIFLSVTHKLSFRQARFFDLVCSFLETYHFKPVTIGRNIASTGEAIFSIRDIIESSQATLVIAFKKVEILPIAYEAADHDQISIASKLILASIWNHIEAAMAIQARKPLLILCENGIHLEGAFRWKHYSLLSFDVEDSQEHLSEELTATLSTWIKAL